MINFINTKFSPSVIQYTLGNKVFRKEIPGNTCAAFAGLTAYGQVINEQSLINQGITIYDQIGGTYINRGGGFQTGFRGMSGATGMTFSTPLVTTATGWTFVSTLTSMANNTVSASTTGNAVAIAFSGTAVSTQAWRNAVMASAFSGHGFTIVGESPNTFITPSTTTFAISASTASCTVTDYILVRDNAKDSDNYRFSSLNFATATAFLKLSVF